MFQVISVAVEGINGFLKPYDYDMLVQVFMPFMPTIYSSF